MEEEPEGLANCLALRAEEAGLCLAWAAGLKSQTLAAATLTPSQFGSSFRHILCLKFAS